MKTGDQLFDELQSLIVDSVGPLSEKIKFDKNDLFDFFLVTSYCSIFEKSWAILAVVEKEVGSQGLAILRSQLDLYADMTNVLKNRDYLLGVELRHLTGIRLRLVEAKKGNPYMAAIASNIDLDSELSEIGKKIKQLKARGAKIIEPKEKMKMAGLENEYHGIYGHLSENAHGGLGALVSRHFHQIDQDFEIKAFPEESKNDNLALLQTSIDVILRSSSLIHCHFDTGHNGSFDQMIENQL